MTSPQLDYVHNCILCCSFFTNESETSREVEESSEPDNSDVIQVTCGVRMTKNQAMRLSLEPQV